MGCGFEKGDPGPAVAIVGVIIRINAPGATLCTALCPTAFQENHVTTLDFRTGRDSTPGRRTEAAIVCGACARRILPWGIGTRAIVGVRPTGGIDIVRRGKGRGEPTHGSYETQSP